MSDATSNLRNASKRMKSAAFLVADAAEQLQPRADLEELAREIMRMASIVEIISGTETQADA